MGINLTNADWCTAIARNRSNDPNGTRFFQGEVFENSGNIHCTPQGEEVIEARKIKYDEKGKALPSTKRGRRRRERRG